MAIPRKLEEYCKSLTDKLMTDSFPKNGKISGEGILNFCSIKQVNLFVIKNLLIQWKRDLDSFRSPYFNFESPDVVKARENFANILSRNILIASKDFHPLLLKSVKEAISLMTTPYEFYLSFAAEAKTQSYGEDELKSIEKYIKHNNFIYSDFIKLAANNNFAASTYKQSIDAIFNNTSEEPEDLTEHLNSFSSILELRPEILLDSEVVQNEKDTELTEKPVRTVAEVHETDEEQATLNDSLKSDESKSLADVHHEKKIDDIRASINLNQRFMFINGLFDGDEERFNQTIEKLESLGSLEDAREYLTTELNWDEGQEEVGEFLQLLTKRLG